MKKKILKFFSNLLNKPIIKVLFYVFGILLILALSGAFSSESAIINTVVEIITSQDMLSLFLAGLLSVGMMKLLNWFESYMEESMKIEDDHHKLITQYSKHNSNSNHYNQSFVDKQGTFLTLHCLHESMKKPTEPTEGSTKMDQKKYKKDIRKWNRAIASRNSVKDEQSNEYLTNLKRVEKYLSGELCLCSINVFANVGADTSIIFEDSSKKHELPSFVITHADELLQAHKNSQKNNSSTIRLDDFDYDVDSKRLVLKTSRSTYYHMLVTNRCMDYKFANGLSIRELYEYEDEICPLERSKLGNQIGINGLIVTNDNYILIEKRGRKKITWKNKFAQSISLALKLKDLGLLRREILDNDPVTAERTIKHIIEKTIYDNFGLTGLDYSEISISENFLGIARDLLEGGKPNFYFYVQTNCSAAELKEKLEKNAKVTQADNQGRSKEDKLKVISYSKLESEYYLVPFSDIEIDYQYRMFLDRKKSLRIHRKLYPRCKKRIELWDKLKDKVSRIFNPVFVRECGEALLVTLAYMELRKKGSVSKEKEE
jgi:hypothetical protein